MKGYRVLRSKLILIICKAAEEIDAGNKLSAPDTLRAAEEGRSIQYFQDHINLQDRRWEIQNITDEDVAFLNDHFSSFAASSADYWPFRNNGLCFYIAWATELIARNYCTDFSDIDE